ncbi:hypothetical protein RSAG8_03213, partial [Rhizoctonia solani AG-8 WAC10335]
MRRCEAKLYAKKMRENETWMGFGLFWSRAWLYNTIPTRTSIVRHAVAIKPSSRRVLTPRRLQPHGETS